MRTKYAEDHFVVKYGFLENNADIATALYNVLIKRKEKHGKVTPTILFSE